MLQGCYIFLRVLVFSWPFFPLSVNTDWTLKISVKDLIEMVLPVDFKAHIGDCGVTEFKWSRFTSNCIMDIVELLSCELKKQQVNDNLVKFIHHKIHHHLQVSQRYCIFGTFWIFRHPRRSEEFQQDFSDQCHEDYWLHVMKGFFQIRMSVILDMLSLQEYADS